MDDLAKLITALSTLAWPIVVTIILFKLIDPLRDLVSSASGRKFTIKVAGNELTMEEVSEQQRVIISDLQTKVADIENRNSSEAQVPQSQVTVPSADKKRVLWVDDDPKNNSFLIANMEERGVQVDIALTTSEGLKMFGKNRYDIVISDMRRPEGDKAGIDLTQKIKAFTLETPIFIFCGAWAARNLREEAISAGADIITSSGTTLLNAMKLSDY